MKAFLYCACAINFSHFVLYPDYRISFFMPLAFRFADYNWKTKQMIFSYFFKGVNLDEFDAVCYRFFMERGENLLYQDAVKQIKQHLYRGDEIVVISASIDNWVKPFAESLGINQVLGTQLELSGTGHLTGRFATANCYGEEKVKRLLQLYPDRTQYRLVVYGDSRGDKELLAFSDESYYKQFNR